MNNPPRQPTYNEQIAQWRQDRMRQQVEQRKQDIVQEYREASRERDQAIANNDMETAEENDSYCQNLEAEWQEYHPPQPPQMDPRLQKFHAANRDYVDRLIARHGNEKATAFLNAVDARLTAPKNLQDPSKGGMGIARYSQEYFDRGKDFLELYSEGVSGVPYEPNATLTADEAAKISGVSPQQYNRSAQVLQQQGRYSWQQNRK
jgi:hypothetical protein